MLQALPDLRRRFDVSVRVHVIERLDPQMYPAPRLLAAYSLADAQRLAAHYRMKFASSGPDIALPNPTSASRALAAIADSEAFFTRAEELGTAFWTGQEVAFEGDTVSADRRLRADEAVLGDWRHYASAMLYYGNEWYWGLDRLDHLERRLLKLGLARNAGETVRFDRTWRGIFEPAGDRPHRHRLEYFLSARSPYSYIGFFQARRFAAAHGIELEPKPVLPMVMRGMPVPRNKRLYILTDAKREAEKAGLAFGNIADPLGPGIERAYAVAHWARATGRLESFLGSLLRAVAVDAIDVATDRGLKKVVLRAGLDWGHARRSLNDERWRKWVGGHRDEMTAAGIWGVPCLRYGNTTAWGQDRFWLIRQAIIAEDNAA